MGAAPLQICGQEGKGGLRESAQRKVKRKEEMQATHLENRSHDKNICRGQVQNTGLGHGHSRHQPKAKGPENEWDWNWHPQIT